MADTFLETINQLENEIKQQTYAYFFFAGQHRHIARNHLEGLALIHLRTRVRQVDGNVRLENSKFIDLKKKVIRSNTYTHTHLFTISISPSSDRYFVH